ncbi:hypothetical protein F5880DRAFT_1702032, partial [Lentinula raphanica]
MRQNHTPQISMPCSAFHQLVQSTSSVGQSCICSHFREIGKDIKDGSVFTVLAWWLDRLSIPEYYRILRPLGSPQDHGILLMFEI